MTQQLRATDNGPENGQASTGSVASGPALPAGLIPATLAGRCANGYERGRGHVVHALPAIRAGSDVAAHARSLCGKTHGARSAGWSPRIDTAVTCPTCLRKAAVWQ